MSSDLHGYFSPVEQAIRRAMQEGLFDNLPGTGKPLNLNGDDDPNTPDDQRLAYKIMKDNDIAPEWMMLGDMLTQQQAKIREELAKGLRAYQGALHDADQQGNIGRRAHANATWNRLLGMFQELINQYNQHVLVYNLKVPPGIAKRHYLDLEREIARIENRS